jgi:hypothetical protein
LTSGSRRVVLALVLALHAAAPCGAVDVKLWPLFRYAHDETTDEMRWSEFRDLRIRPLIWLRQHRGPAHDDSSDILYPLASTRWTDDYQSFRFLLFTYRTSPTGSSGPAGERPPPERWSSRMTLFPFVFYRHEPEAGTRLSVLPFWLDLDDFLGYEHVRAVMFPGYLALTEPRVERRFYGFPFVSTVGGPDGRGFRLWPFFGTKDIVDREHTRYVLWPFYIRSERLIPGYGWESQRIDFPVYAAIDGPVRQSRAWGVVAHTHTIDWVERTEVTGAPWPFTLRARLLGEEEYFTWRLAPFYGRSDRDGISSRFYAWPMYRRKYQDVDDFHYRRQDVLAILWRRQTVESSGRSERLETIFPLLRAETVDERDFGQAPALVDSLLPKNRGILALWAPLYGAVRWDTEADRSRDWNLLWGLVAREEGRWRSPWSIDLDRWEGAADGG